MDVPSSAAGIVKEIRVTLGDKISEGFCRRCCWKPRRRRRCRLQAAKPAAAAPLQPSTPQLRRRPRPLLAAAASAGRPRRPPRLQRPASQRLPPGLALGAAQAHASPSVRAVCPRAWRRPVQGSGERAEGPHHQGRRHRLRQGRHVRPHGSGQRRGARRGDSGRRPGSAALAEGRLRQVRRLRGASRCRASRRSPARISPATG